MIKLIVIARCIPEDVYLRSLEQPTPVLAGEKKFSVVVRDPESWYIGRLAIEIKSRYENLYKRPFGQIKYLKDGDDDCDLDPELSVADLLVDEGKAARDGADQKRIVKVIQEQGRAIRQGSVVPDLTPIHYQPPLRPPVPKFPNIEKRTPQEVVVDNRPTKRRRLDQIDEEEGENIVRSIEGHTVESNARQENAINGDSLEHPLLEPKQESPEQTRPWVNTAPATRDELELLPQPPDNWNQHSRPGGFPLSTLSRSHAEDIQVTSNPQLNHALNHRTPSANRDRESAVNRVVQQPLLANSQTPITPPYTVNAGHTPAAQAVSMLNGMKSASPGVRQSTSSSASRFRKSRKNMYDPPESDIDDSQMSPGSRASRTKITPKLVRTPQSRNSNATEGSLSFSTSARNDTSRSLTVESHKKKGSQDIADINGSDLPQSRDLGLNNRQPRPVVVSSLRAGSDSSMQKQTSGHEDAPVDKATTAPQGDISKLNSDETWSAQENGSKIRKKKQSQKTKSKSISNVEPSSSRSTSIASSNHLSAQKASKKQRTKRIAPTKVADTGDQYDVDDSGGLDSPGAQLEESLRQSSPAQQKPREAPSSKSVARAKSTTASKAAISKLKDATDEGDDVGRPPDSISDFDEFMQPVNIPKRLKTASKSKGKEAAEDRRCFTCWGKSARCDNKKPRCSTCEKNGKTCQLFHMTKEAAQTEKAKRKSGKPPSSSSTSTPKNSARPKQKSKKHRLSEEIVSATDRDEDLSDEKASFPSKKLDEKHQQTLEIVKRPAKVSEGHTANVAGQRTENADERPQEPPKAVPKGSIDTKPGNMKTPSPTNGTSEMLSVSSDAQGNREKSTDSRATSNNRVLPPGMTQEEYDILVKGRAGLTEDQRRAQKWFDKKSSKQTEKQSTPLVARSQSAQDLTEKGTASINSDEKVPSSTQLSSKRSQPQSSSKLAKTATSMDPAPVSIPQTSNTAPTKSKASQPAGSSSIVKSKLKIHPSVATTAAALDSKKHQNPPYRPPQQRPLPTTPAAPTIGQPKSLRDFRAQLQEQKKTGSSASTPQPQSATAKLATSASNKQHMLKKGFSLGDDDDDDSDEDEGDDSTETASEDGQAGNKSKNKQPERLSDQTAATPGLVTDGTGKVLVRRRALTPSDDGSESSGPPIW